MRLSSLALFAFALGLRLVYVFAAPCYRLLLYSDCLGYWRRALSLLGGDVTGAGQWACWPPAGHLLLAVYLGLLSLAHVPVSAWLPCALLAGCVLGAASCVWLRGLVELLYPSAPGAGLVAGLLYACAWPQLYQSQYILSENVAVPLLIGGLALAVSRGCLAWHGPWLGGLLLGLACAVRPQFLPVLAVVWAMLYAVYGDRHRFAVDAVLPVLLPACLVLALAVDYNWCISGGKLDGLAANGGINAAITQGRFQVINAAGLMISAPEFNGGPFSTHRVWHAALPVASQSYYYHLAWVMFQQGFPGSALSDLCLISHLWVGPRFPSAPTPFFLALEPVTQAVSLVLGLGALLAVPVCAAWRKTTAASWLLWGIALVPVLLAPVWGAERRFGYAVSFADLALLSVALVRLWEGVRPLPYRFGGYSEQTLWEFERVNPGILANMLANDPEPGYNGDNR